MFAATSHPNYQDDTLQDMVEGVYSTLKREWNIERDELIYPPKHIGKIYYKSSDGKFIEHEVCYFYVSEIKSLPKVNFEYAYGYSLMTVEELKSKLPLSKAIAPWIQEALNKNLL
jgi:isopentenyldiphosphate isomerase